MITKQSLDYLGDKIEIILSQKKINGRCVGGTVGHSHIRFDLLTHTTPFNEISSLTEEFSLALGKTVTVDRLGNNTVLLVPTGAEQPTLAKFLQAYKNRIPINVAFLGYDHHDSPVMVRFAKEDVKSAACVGANARALVTTIYQSLKQMGNNMGSYIFADLDKTGMPDAAGKFLVACSTQPLNVDFAVTVQESESGWQMQYKNEKVKFIPILTETKQQTKKELVAV